MSDVEIDKLFKRKMSRRQFLRFAGLTALSMFGVLRVISELKSHAASDPNAIEPEGGTLTSPATRINDQTASGGSAVKFGASTTLGVPGSYQPDATTTGWRRLRSSLTAHSGDMTVTTGGTASAPLIIEDSS